MTTNTATTAEFPTSNCPRCDGHAALVEGRGPSVRTVPCDNPACDHGQVRAGCYLCGEAATCTAHLTGDYANFVPGVHPVCPDCLRECIELGEVSNLTPAERAKVAAFDGQHRIDLTEIAIEYSATLPPVGIRAVAMAYLDLATAGALR